MDKKFEEWMYEQAYEALGIAVIKSMYEELVDHYKKTLKIISEDVYVVEDKEKLVKLQEKLYWNRKETRAIEKDIRSSTIIWALNIEPECIIQLALKTSGYKDWRARHETTR